MLALVDFIDHLRYYLLGCKFSVRTDHQALKWLLEFREPQGQVARWLERLQEYHFDVEHRPGNKHTNADALSRRPRRRSQHGDCPSCKRGQPEVNKAHVSTVNGDSKEDTDSPAWHVGWRREDLARAQRDDPDIGPVLQLLTQGEGKPTPIDLQGVSTVTRAIWAQFELLHVVNDVLYIRQPQAQPTKDPLVLPADLVKPALAVIHDGPAGNHGGAEKTLKKMKARFWRPGMSTAVREYCRNCVTCAACKSSRKPKAPLQPMATGHPMQRVHMDIVGPLPRSEKGNLYILTVQCSFTKWVEAYPLRNQRAVTCASVFVKNWVCRYGVPESIHSDQGRNFESNVFKEMCKLLQMRKTRTTTYHPQGNGQIENFHRTLKALL